MPLSDMTCRIAMPKEKPYKLFDGEGLYLEVMPSGVKSWRLKYRIHGKEKRIAFGQYPKVSLSEARKQKSETKEYLRKGIDPVVTRIEARHAASLSAEQTFELIAMEWHQVNIAQWDPRYAQTIKHRLEQYAFPFIGQLPISEIKAPSILACLRQIEQTGPEMARRIKQLCSHVFRFAIATGKADTDPTYGLETALKKYKKGHFASIDVDELSDLIKALETHKCRLYRQTYIAVNLMLLTFVRTTELLEAKWSEIKFEDARWIIPAVRMKKTKDHIVPLSKQSIAWLLELKQLNGHRDYLFPSIPRPKKPMSDGTILAALKRMGYEGKMTGHGFRSLALGILKEKLGFSHEVADRQLAHVKKSSTDRAYDRAEFLPQRTKMMQKYADYIDKVKRKSLSKNSSPS